MIYLALDTCAWLELLKTDFNKEDNHFDELLYWIENGDITCVTTENLLKEWNRHKVSKKEGIIDAFTSVAKLHAGLMSGTHAMDKIYTTDLVEKALSMRIDRLDLLFSSKAEIAKESDAIYLEAAKRNLDFIAPNHIQDSFRDTVNILTLKHYIIQKGYEKCIFTTINHKDFSDSINKENVHNQLSRDFIDGKLEYIYFTNSHENFAGRLFGPLRSILPKLSEHLKKQKAKEEEKKLLEKKEERELRGEASEPEYLEDTMQIDRIVQSGKRTKLDEVILKTLFDKNPIYQSYFTKKMAEYGLV